MFFVFPSASQLVGVWGAGVLKFLEFPEQLELHPATTEALELGKANRHTGEHPLAIHIYTDGSVPDSEARDRGYRPACAFVVCFMYQHNGQQVPTGVFANRLDTAGDFARRLTGGILAGGPGVAWLAGADTWADTGAVGATARATQGQLTLLAPPAGLSEAAQSYTLDISFWSFCPGPTSHF